MTPNQLVEGLRNLAMQAPIDAVLFRVPSAPACTDHNMRLDVSPRDVLDLLECIPDNPIPLLKTLEPDED